MTNQQLLIGGALLWFWMQREKSTPTVGGRTNQSNTSQRNTGSGTGNQSAADKMRNGETLEQTKEREQTKRDKQWQDFGIGAGKAFLPFLKDLMARK